MFRHKVDPNLLISRVLTRFFQVASIICILALPAHALDSEDIEFYTLGYHKKTLDDYKGKPVILHFWATWCAPCVEELPEVDKTQAAYSDKLTIITLSEDIKRSLVTDFYRDHNINHLTMFFDKRMKLLTKLGGRALPASLFYDKNHRLVKRIDRTVDWELEETKALLDSLVR